MNIMIPQTAIIAKIVRNWYIKISEVLFGNYRSAEKRHDYRDSETDKAGRKPPSHNT